MSVTVAKRGFWRIHLSTAVLMMLAAGVMVRSNLVRRPFDRQPLYPSGNPGDREYALGCPMTWVEHHVGFDSLWNDLHFKWKVEVLRGTQFRRTGAWIRTLTPLGADMFVGLCAVLLVAIANEWRIRRRARA